MSYAPCTSQFAILSQYLKYFFFIIISCIILKVCLTSGYIYNNPQRFNIYIMYNAEHHIGTTLTTPPRLSRSFYIVHKVQNKTTINHYSKGL